MNILYVITKADRGGAQQHVRDLAIEFKKKGNHVTVAIGENHGWLIDELREQSVHVEHVRLKRTWNPLVFFRYLFDLAHVIRRTQPDVVHFHSSHVLIGTWIIRFFSRARSIVTIHGLSILYPGAARRSVQDLYALFLKMVLLCADQVICVCEFDRDQLVSRKLVRPGHVTIVHNGIDSPRYLSQTEARQQLGINENAIVIGALGRFSYPKNLTLLINAFYTWNHPTALLCLIGSGPEEIALKQHARDLGLSERVLFRQGDATLLKAFSCFVLSSRYEGFPYVLLEAAFAEVPIITTNVGGVSELIEQNKTGWLVPSGDAESLTIALQDFVSRSQDASVYSVAARTCVESQFTKALMMQKIEKVYHVSI